MSNKEKHTTKKLIQNIDLDTPSVNFTDKVMTKVNSIPDELILKDVILTSLLKENSLEVPNPYFSTNIMNKVNANFVADYKPIISKKSWNIIFLFFTGFIGYILLSKPTISNQNKYVSEFSTFFNNLISDLGNSLVQNIEIPSILIVSILCLSLLLLLDAALRTKRLF